MEGVAGAAEVFPKSPVLGVDDPPNPNPEEGVAGVELVFELPKENPEEGVDGFDGLELKENALEGVDGALVPNENPGVEVAADEPPNPNVEVGVLPTDPPNNPGVDGVEGVAGAADPEGLATGGSTIFNGSFSLLSLDRNGSVPFSLITSRRKICIFSFRVATCDANDKNVSFCDCIISPIMDDPIP